MSNDIRHWFGTPKIQSGLDSLENPETPKPPLKPKGLTPNLRLANSSLEASKKTKSAHAWGNIVRTTTQSVQIGRQAPYSLSFSWTFSDYARFPGTGDFSFDSLRNHPDKYASTATEVDFRASLQYVLRHAGSVLGETSLQLLLDVLDETSVTSLAILFYKRNIKWSRTDKFFPKLDFETLIKEKLCLQVTQDSELCYTLFTREELMSFFSNPPKASLSKAELVQLALKLSIVHPPCVRLRPSVFQALLGMHQFVFCSHLLEPEDASCLLRSTFFSRKQDEVIPLLFHPQCWARLSQVLSWLEEMAKEVGEGNAAEVFRLLHLACDDLDPPCSCLCNLHRKRHNLLHRLILTGIGLLERERRYGEAIHYLTHVLHSWEVGRTENVDEPNPSPSQTFFACKIVHRLCIDLGHVGREEEALILLERVLRQENLILLSAPLSTRLGLTCGKSLNRLGGVGMGLILLCARLAQPPRRWRPRIVYNVRDLPETHLVLQRKEGVRVEHLALEEYKRRGFPQGQHCENGILHTVFGLLCLDAVGLNDAMPVVNVKAILLRVEKGEGGQVLKESWERKLHTQLRGVNWTRNSLEELVFFCEVWGGRAVSLICRFFLDAYEAWCGGVGDLLLWDVVQRRVRFVEVKGPGDSLSDRQRAWGEKLLEAGLEAEVCYVTWAPVAKPEPRKTGIVEVIPIDD